MRQDKLASGSAKISCFAPVNSNGWVGAEGSEGWPRALHLVAQHRSALRAQHKGGVSGWGRRALVKVRSQQREREGVGGGGKGGGRGRALHLVAQQRGALKGGTRKRQWSELVCAGQQQRGLEGALRGGIPLPTRPLST